MKFVIPIDQKASIAAGFDAPNSTEVFDLPASLIPEDIRSYIAAQYDFVKGVLSPYIKISEFDPALGYVRNNGQIMPSLIHPVTTESVTAWLRSYYDAHYTRFQEELETRRKEKVAEEKRIAEQAERNRLHRIEEDAAIEAFLSNPDARGESYDCRIPATGAIRDSGNYIFIFRNNPKHEFVLKEIQRRNTADREKAETEAKEKAAAKRKFTLDWLAKHGTQNQIERFEAGVLPENEYLDAMADQAFASCSEFPRYVPLTSRDVRDHAVAQGDVDEHYARELAVKFSSEESAAVAAAAWQRGTEILTKLGDEAEIEHLTHQGTLDSRDVPWYDLKHSIKATVQFGPFTFSRKFAAE